MYHSGEQTKPKIMLLHDKNDLGRKVSKLTILNIFKDTVQRRPRIG